MPPQTKIIRHFVRSSKSVVAATSTPLLAIVYCPFSDAITQSKMVFSIKRLAERKGSIAEAKAIMEKRGKRKKPIRNTSESSAEAIKSEIEVRFIQLAQYLSLGYYAFVTMTRFR